MKPVSHTMIPHTSYTRPTSGSRIPSSTHTNTWHKPEQHTLKPPPPPALVRVQSKTDVNNSFNKLINDDSSDLNLKVGGNSAQFDSFNNNRQRSDNINSNLDSGNFNNNLNNNKVLSNSGVMKIVNIYPNVTIGTQNIQSGKNN
jgi:hypothetical protein